MTRSRWRVALVALLALSAAALAGCAGSSENETSRETTPPILGADARVGQVRVDDVYVDAPRGAARGANAPLRLTLSNDGRRADALVSVVTPAAKRVGLLVDGRPRAAIPLPAGTQRDGQDATDALLVSLREPLAPDSSIVVTFRSRKPERCPSPWRWAADRPGCPPAPPGPLLRARKQRQSRRQLSSSRSGRRIMFPPLGTRAKIVSAP